MLLQGQGVILRSNTALYILNHWWDLQITAHLSRMKSRCVVNMFDQVHFKVIVIV